MGMVNRRHALLGWAVWKIGKVVGKKKAKKSLWRGGDHAGLSKGALATIGAATVAAVLFWRKKSDDSSDNGS